MLATALAIVAVAVLACDLMKNRHDHIAPPADATEYVGDWQLDHDGYGRPFRGTRRGEVVIQGWQHADGQSERSILIDTGTGHGVELTHPRATAQAILDATAEVNGLQ